MVGWRNRDYGTCPMDTATMSSTREIQLPRAADAAGRARGFLRGQVGDRLGAGARANAELVVSELVTNAVVHGKGVITLKLELAGDSLRVEVVDEGAGAAPAIREQGADDGGGWGLRIVETLALEWGAYEGTTHVWAELAVD